MMYKDITVESTFLGATHTRGLISNGHVNNERKIENIKKQEEDITQRDHRQVAPTQRVTAVAAAVPACMCI